MSSKPHEQRVIDEQKELGIKLTALREFLKKDQPSFIDDNNWYLLGVQEKTMTQYNNILLERIKLFGVD